MYKVHIYVDFTLNKKCIRQELGKLGQHHPHLPLTSVVNEPGYICNLGDR